MQGLGAASGLRSDGNLHCKAAEVPEQAVIVAQ